MQMFDHSLNFVKVSISFIFLPPLNMINIETVQSCFKNKITKNGNNDPGVSSLNGIFFNDIRLMVLL